ncbi:DUF5047 domain-containing protein [Kribbella sp. CA-293567]|uniref:DUF5047 domain-containing protein n=1 Tax=Kribbella sp. CA-293567 TaxID=3002436 RepID=UPI0022DDCD3F|nr:DUF5047 domain-containing protein [Kribbella sp. CA-293567]WBQ02938.1 DUF5047 domain-containing protein [Kribbella sp. CA-293567]
MRAVSSQFLETLRGSHLSVFRARVCTTYQTGTNPSGIEIPVQGGDVKASATADIRATLELITSESWPRLAADLLTPYGNEIYVERGLAYGNGQREWVGLGYFRIETPEQDEVPDGVVAIQGSDRMAGIRDAQFLAPRQFAASLTRGQLVSTLITEVYPSAVIAWDSTTVRDGLVGRSVIAEDDRAGTLQDFLTSLGKVGYFDHTGTFQVKTPPSTAGAATWTIDAGHDGVLVEMSRGLTRQGVYNAVVATGEAGDTTAPARAVAYNLDPDSPTYYLGRFGPVPRFYSSPFLTTNAQALSAATSLLRQQLGLPYQVELASIANPALEPFDVIAVRYPKAARSRSLRTETHVIDQVTIPLDSTVPVTLQTREQQTELIGDSA